MIGKFARHIKPYKANVDIRNGERTLRGFVWRASGVHQLYAGILAACVALLTFAPVDLQRRIVDDGISAGSTSLLFLLGGLYAGAILLQATLKYFLFVYQGWVGESVVREARDQIARIAQGKAAGREDEAGKTVNVIGREIDAVGGFVGTSISEFVVNLTLLLAVSGYMIYIEPIIALVSAICLLPQVFLAFYMQRDLNDLVERQVSLVRKLGSQAADDDDGRVASRSILQTVLLIFQNRMHFNILKFGLKELLNVANAAAPLAVLLVGGWLVVEGRTTLGTVVAFVAGLDRLSSPMRDLLDFYRVYQQAGVQYEMIRTWAARQTSRGMRTVG